MQNIVHQSATAVAAVMLLLRAASVPPIGAAAIALFCRLPRLLVTGLCECVLAILPMILLLADVSNSIHVM